MDMSIRNGFKYYLDNLLTYPLFIPFILQLTQEKQYKTLVHHSKGGLSDRQIPILTQERKIRYVIVSMHFKCIHLKINKGVLAFSPKNRIKFLMFFCVKKLIFHLYLRHVHQLSCNGPILTTENGARSNIHPIGDCN